MSRTASSTVGLSGTLRPRRMVKSEHTITLAAQSSMRDLSAAVPIPAYTTEWIAPMRAHASIATMPSGTSGM